MPIAKESKTYDPCPEGTHIARCYGCISLGTQHSPNFADAFKLMLLFELPHERIQLEEGKDMPMTISKGYTLSLGKKANLRKHLDAWRGKAFNEEELKGWEVSKVVGAPCQITVVHGVNGKGNRYAKIESITGLAKGMTCPPQEHSSMKYEIEQGKDNAFSVLPEWIQKKIESCEEWKPSTQQAASVPADEASAQTALTPEVDVVPF
jgi:hypothetical protein